MNTVILTTLQIYILQSGGGAVQSQGANGAAEAIEIDDDEDEDEEIDDDEEDDE